MKKDKLSTAAAELGRKGGKARAKKLTAKERSDIARNAVNARWRKRRKANAEKKGRAESQMEG